jgi:hypothetical protein
MAAKVAGIAVVVAIATAALLLATGMVRIPDRWNPLAPLRVEDPPNLLTRHKLERLSRDPQACRAALAATPFRYASVPDREPRDGCGWRDAVRIDATGVAVGDPFTLTCESAVALALFERHVLQPAAVAHFGQPVAAIRHFGSYACRNLYGKADARRSEHASANALDVAAFTLRDGRDIAVRNDWDGDDAKARFLRDVHQGACGFFDVVLGPDYNAAHRDHLHFDRGTFRVCR